MKNILSLQLPVEKGDYDKLPADFYKTQTSQTDEIGFWRSSWRRLRENKIAMVSLVIILAHSCDHRLCCPWAHSFTLFL